MKKATTTTRKAGNSQYFLAPHTLRTDTAWPFRPNDDLIMVIHQGMLVIKKVQK